MFAAAQCGNVGDLKAALEGGADVAARDGDGNTALMWASYEGHEECVKLLLAAGPEVDAKDRCGYTALMWAAQGGHAQCLRALLGASADVEAKNPEGTASLARAADEGHEECVSVLLEAGRMRSRWPRIGRLGKPALEIQGFGRCWRLRGKQKSWVAP